eukprot:2097199-Rhodomonas_salina.1
MPTRGSTRVHTAPDKTNETVKDPRLESAIARSVWGSSVPCATPTFALSFATKDSVLLQVYCRGSKNVLHQQQNIQTHRRLKIEIDVTCCTKQSGNFSPSRREKCENIHWYISRAVTAAEGVVHHRSGSVSPKKHRKSRQHLHEPGIGKNQQRPR